MFIMADNKSSSLRPPPLLHCPNTSSAYCRIKGYICHFIPFASILVSRKGGKHSATIGFLGTLPDNAVAPKRPQHTAAPHGL
jgi:hypothetical protein